jgi:hypothetical protein
MRHAFNTGNTRYAEDILKERQAFYQEYKDQVKSLLFDWYGNQAFIKNIGFESNGRVVIEADLDLTGEKYSYFPSIIRRVKGSLSLSGNNIKQLDYIEDVTGDVDLHRSGVFSIKSLKKVGGDFDARAALGLEDVSSLEGVGGRVIIDQTQIEQMEALSYVGKSFYAGGFLRKLSNLRWVGGDLGIRKSQIESLPKLEEVVGEFNAVDLETLTSLPNLKKVKHLFLQGTKVEHLPTLIEVDRDFSTSECLKTAPELKEVGLLELNSSIVFKFPKLRTVSRSLNIQNAFIADFRDTFPRLETVQDHVVTYQSGIARELELLKKKGDIYVGGSIILQKS